MRGIADPPETVRTADDPAEFAEAIVSGLDDDLDAAGGRAGASVGCERTARFRTNVNEAAAEAARAA